MRSTDGRQILGLDHLRALAAILIFYFHGIHQLGVPTDIVPRNWVLSLFEEGWVGVSLFITITGFMFTVLTHGKKIDYFPFLKNRVLRLFPLIFLVTLFAIRIDEKIPNTALFIFFNLLGGGAVFGTWTLAIEFQFYLAYPFLRDRLMQRGGWRSVLICLCLVAFFAMLRVAFYVEKGEVQTLAYGTIFGRADEFVAGILAGMAYLRMRGRESRYLWAALGICVLIVLLLQHWFNATGGFYHRPTYPSPSRIWIFWPTLSGLLCGCLICTYCLATERCSGVASRAAAYLGTISYSIYMLHFITLPMATGLWKAVINLPLSPDLLANGTFVLLLWHLPITLAMSAASYEFIEKPFLRKRSPYLILPACTASPTAEPPPA